MGVFYGVRKGRKVGVFSSWDECKKQVIGYKGADFRKFLDYGSAFDYAYNMEDDFHTDVNGVVYAYVDGSYKNGVYGYGVVLVKDKEIILKDLGRFTHSKESKSQSVYSELKAAMRAVELAIANDIYSLVIVYDFKGIKEWALGNWKCKKPICKEYYEFMQKYSQYIKIRFQKCKAHNSNKYNEIADNLANIAINL